MGYYDEVERLVSNYNCWETLEKREREREES